MKRINNQNIPQDYSLDLVTTGTTVIRDFLQPDYAEDLWQFFHNEMPSDWWYSSTFPNKNGEISNIRNLSENRQEILQEIDYVNSLMGAGRFSYQFYRTLGNHATTCYCKECELRKWLNSEELLSFISQVTGERYTHYGTIFASRYSAGSFLSPHHDHKNGDIGFVLQLTKDWQPQWGGLLHFLDKESQRKVEGTEVPTFNTLTLFDIPEDGGRWHYVSHVNPGVTESRLAVTGWFVKEK
jgi:SM-20-related protein